jgi:sulfatase maturation enzyme AslB (radical SAM superfamily)
MNEGLKIYPAINLSGPARIDLMFDKSCNLACRTCSTEHSTFWQKYLQQPVTPSHSKEMVISALKRLDLSNLRMLVFCGGETLLGQEYWDVAEWLGDNVPNAKQQLTLCFQTNGTQPIHPRNYDIIEKFFLVKLQVSLDGFGPRFEYLRWPASWSQVTDNILTLRDTVPSNVMFLVEETVSIFNLAYLHELDTWVKQNFRTNREGDPVDHTRHLAKGTFKLENCSQEYVDWTSDLPLRRYIGAGWKESSQQIQFMLNEIHKHDHMRQQQFSLIFPQVAEFYQRWNADK